MDTDPTVVQRNKNEERIAVLLEEAKAIDFANQLYWKRKDHSPEAAAEYQHRQERLEEIARAVTGAQSKPGGN